MTCYQVVTETCLRDVSDGPLKLQLLYTAEFRMITKVLVIPTCCFHVVRFVNNENNK